MITLQQQAAFSRPPPSRQAAASRALAGERQRLGVRGRRSRSHGVYQGHLGGEPAARGAMGLSQAAGRGQAGGGEQRRLDPTDLSPHELTEKREALAAQEQCPRILVIPTGRVRVPLRAVPNAQAGICRALRTSERILENIAILDSHYVRIARP